VRRDLRTALETCAPPLPLARFFRGGRALGQPCEQSVECESQHCAADPAGNPVCAEQAASLCDPADI